MAQDTKGSSGADVTKTSGGETLPQFPATGPDAFSRNLATALDRGARALALMLEEQKLIYGPYSAPSEASEASHALASVMEYWLNHPEKLTAAQTRLAGDFVELWGRTYARFLGQQVEPLAKPERGDQRFKDPEWDENPFFDFLKQAYLLTSNWAGDLVVNADGLEERKKKRAQFYLEQMTTALSPSNFPFSNPEVIRTTLETNAENLVEGMDNLLADLERSGDLLKIRQTDMSAFKVGENLAVTPGKVVFRNPLFELIQYEPTTPQVHETPIMIVPPWINKYYILDLVPKKSFVKYLVDQGYTVFMVSWVNPGPELADKSFADYMSEGLLTASDVVRQICGVEQIIPIGYCVGGTLLAATLAYCASRADERFRAVGLLTAQTDFTKAGDLLVFIDDKQLDAIDRMMKEHGYLDGSRMGTVFNMLRPRDLIWPYVVNNYLLAKEPFPFDLLFWNSDSTRMTPANHSFYLRAFYHLNKLARGEMELGGVTLDLSKVTAPIYELATREDHIAPAESVFAGSKLFGGPVRFVLAASGHIAGVVNPPEKQKYKHWTGGDGGSEGPSAREFDTLEGWLEAAREHPGSWWPDFIEWLRPYAGQTVEARQPGAPSYPPLEDAPGRYVTA
jgi:polyhydroxyalkanoate synthase